MNNSQLIQKIMLKKEFSQLPKKDVELVLGKFDKRKIGDGEKIKLTRALLHKIFSSFSSSKLFNLKDKDEKWFLRKHLSTRERLDSYEKLYKKLFKNMEQKEISIVDLGAGINGFSYKFFKKKINYLGVEAMGQLVDLVNAYFKKNKIKCAKTIHLSLFELEKLKVLIKKQKKPRMVFLFKTIDSLELLEKNYSKKLLNEIVPLVNRVVISFATRSFMKRLKFKVKRSWLINFIKNYFEILEDFELGGERYLVFQKSKI